MQLNIHHAPQNTIQLKLRPCEAAELYLQKQPSRHAGNLESPQHIRSGSHRLMSDATSNKIHLKQSFSTAVKLGGKNKHICLEEHSGELFVWPTNCKILKWLSVSIVWILTAVLLRYRLANSAHLTIEDPYIDANAVNHFSFFLDEVLYKKHCKDERHISVGHISFRELQL